MKKEVKLQLINYLLCFSYLFVANDDIKTVFVNVDFENSSIENIFSFLKEHDEYVESDLKKIKELLSIYFYNCNLIDLFSCYSAILGLAEQTFHGILKQTVNSFSERELSLQDEEFYEILLTNNVLHPTTFCYEFYSFEEHDFQLLNQLYLLNKNMGKKYQEVIRTRSELAEYDMMIANATKSWERSEYENDRSDIKRSLSGLEAEMLDLDKKIADVSLEMSDKRQAISRNRTKKDN